LIIGEEMRKEKVTPSGTPDSTNPIKRGTAEQEQKGVTIPKSPARPLPRYWRLLERMRRVLSGGKYERIMAIKKMITVRRRNTLMVS
jgi:hypothetical protein